MCYPRYCLAHYSGISSNITNVTDFRTPPTPLTLAHQPSYPHLHNTYVTHTVASLTLAHQPRNSHYHTMLAHHPHQHASYTTHASTSSAPFLKLESILSSNFCSLLFHQTFLIFQDVLSVFLIAKLFQKRYQYLKLLVIFVRFQ